MFYTAWIRHLGTEFEPFFDFLNPIRVMDLAQPYEPAAVGVLPQDICYPPLAMVWEWVFPPNDFGGLLCTSAGLALYLFGLLAVLRRHGRTHTWPWLLVAGFSTPVVFSFYVGNLILYAAGALNFYFAWYDSDRRWKRLVAAGMLAVATVLKIVPCLAGILYLRERSRRSISLAALSAVLTAVLFFVPFWFCGGAEGIGLWMRNASANSSAYRLMNLHGIYGLAGEIARVFGYRHELLSVAGPVFRIGSVALAVGCLAGAVGMRMSRERALAAVCLGMIFLPPTMMLYGTLYVLPILFVLATGTQGRVRTDSRWAVVAICLPLKIPLMMGSANGLFAAASLVDLAVLILLRRHAP